MTKKIAWIDNYLHETEAYRERLQREFPQIHFELYDNAGSGYTALQKQMSELVVINPYLAPGLEEPYPFLSEIFQWENNYSLVGFDLAQRIRGISFGKIPIILFGWGTEIIHYSQKRRENPCTAASEILNTLDMLPGEFTEIMGKYVQR